MLEDFCIKWKPRLRIFQIQTENIAELIEIHIMFSLI